MNYEEITLPRIKCIEPFLGMERQGWELNLTYTVPLNDDYLFEMSLPKKYPLNFKELKWYEERKPEDMPKYVKSFSGVYLKIHHWDETATLGWCEEICVDIHSNSCVPISKDEYEENMKNKLNSDTEKYEGNSPTWYADKKDSSIQ